MKLLIPGAGNKIYHIKAFQELSKVKKVIITDIYPWTYGGNVADSAYIVPRFDSPKFKERIDQIYNLEKFDFILPIHDFALYYFANNYELFKEKPYIIAMNEHETVEIISDKLKIYEIFKKLNIKSPKTYSLNKFIKLNNKQYPYFIKPRYINMRGTDKQLYLKISDNEDLNYITRKLSYDFKNYIVQDYISGKEINIDFFCDSKGNLKNVTCLYRLDMGKNRGIIRGEIVENNEIIYNLIHKITRNLFLKGANQIQAFEIEDKYFFTEINGRFSGSSIFVKQAGVNYFKYYIKMLNGEDIQIKENASKLKMSSWEKPFFYKENNYIKL